MRWVGRRVQPFGLVQPLCNRPSSSRFEVGRINPCSIATDDMLVASFRLRRWGDPAPSAIEQSVAAELSTRFGAHHLRQCQDDQPSLPAFATWNCPASFFAVATQRPAISPMPVWWTSTPMASKRERFSR